MPDDFHNKPFDAGTLAKLRIFELYTEAWLPVFLSQPKPPFEELHIYDFFSGPGTDSSGLYGSPLRILSQLRKYQQARLAGWPKVRKVVHLFDEDAGKTALLDSTLR